MSESGKQNLADVFLDLMLSVDVEDMIQIIEEVASAINYGYNAGVRCAINEIKEQRKEKESV